MPYAPCVPGLDLSCVHPEEGNVLSRYCVIPAMASAAPKIGACTPECDLYIVGMLCACAERKMRSVHHEGLE